MTLVDAVTSSLRRLAARWLESSLIAVAVALAVAVLAVVAAVLGVRLRAQADFDESLFARQGVVRSVQGNFDGFREADGGLIDVRKVGSIYTPAVRFVYADLAALKTASPSVDYAYVRGFRTFRSDAWDGSLPAASFSADYLGAARIEVIEGSLPSASDFEAERRVIVMTHRFATLLGLEEPVVGKSVEFVGEDAPYTVVGVLPGVADGEPMSIREALVPFRPGQDGVSELWFAVDDAASLMSAASQVESFAASRWEEGATVSVDRDASAAFLREQNARGLAIAFFAAAALVVAASNVLALMLARVVRRQREIGIARSFGATRTVVSGGVMLDAVLLGVIGGVLGVVVGRALLAAYNLQLAADPAGFGVRFTFSLPWALAAAGLAALLALLAALYPAVVASRVRIVDAVSGG